MTQNVTLSLIVTVTIVNHFVSWILIDDESSCNYYFRIFIELGLRKQYMRLCEGQSLVMFNDSSFCLCGHVYLSISLGEGNNNRIMNVCFSVISCKNVYNDILGRPFLAALDVMASPVHLKIKYQNNSGRYVVFKDDLHGARRIKEAILKNP